MKKLFYLLFAALGILFFQLINSAKAQTFPKYKAGKTYQVIAPSGMNMRAEASTKGKVVAKVPLGAFVTLTDEEGRSYGDLTVDKIKGHWVKAKYEGTEGYMFSGYFYNPMEQRKPEHPDFLVAQWGDGETSEPHYDPNLNWYGIFREKGIYSLESVVIHFGGEAFQSMQSNREGDMNIFIGSRKKLKTGPISGQETNYGEDYVMGQSLTPGHQVLMNFDYQGGNTYDMLTTLGTVSTSGYEGFNEMSGEPYVGMKFTNYELRLTRFEENADQPRSQTMIKYSKEAFLPFTLLWYGDVDGDGHSDCLIEQQNEEGDFEQVLYLTTPATKGKLIRRVASVQVWGGC